MWLVAPEATHLTRIQNGRPTREAGELRGSFYMSAHPAPPWEGCTETSRKGLSSSQTLQTGEESQYFFYIQTRAVSDPHRAPVALRQDRLVGAGQAPGAAGAG